MPQPLEYEQAGYNAPDGMQVGRTSADLISFYGATPLARAATNSAISTTAFISTAGIYGFTTSTEALQVVNAISTLSYALRQLGLVT